MTAPRDPFEVMDEARDRSIGWATVALLGWLLGTVVGTAGDSKSAVVVLIAATISSVAIPALVMAGRELSRRSRAKRATTFGGVR